MHFQSNFRSQLPSAPMALSTPLLHQDSDSSLSTICSDSGVTVTDLQQIELKQFPRGINLHHSPIHTTHHRMDRSKVVDKSIVSTEFLLSDEQCGARGGNGGVDKPPPSHYAATDEKTSILLGANYALSKGRLNLNNYISRYMGI